MEGTPETEELGVWCRGTLDDGTLCRSTEVLVVDVSKRHEATRRLLRCKRCGTLLLSIERFAGLAEKRTLRDTWPPDTKGPNHNPLG